MNLDPHMRDLCDLLVEVAVLQIQRSGEKAGRRTCLATDANPAQENDGKYTSITAEGNLRRSAR